MQINWINAQGQPPKSYTCGYCGKVVAAAIGFAGQRQGGQFVYVYICPNYQGPSYFDLDKQIPGVAPGAEIGHLPDAVEKLYREARNSTAIGSYTSAVLTCRKLLMNIAVAQGATEGGSFLNYIEFLAANGYLPPNGRGWVDHIRIKGNEANHEIVLMSKPDAEDLITFLEMLLKFIYEFPKRIPPPSAPS